MSSAADVPEDDELPRPDEALSELDRLVAENLLSAEKAGFARAKLLALKTAVERAKESERSTEERADALEARLQADARRAEMHDDDIMAEELRLQEEVEKAEAEAIRARDRAEAASAEVGSNVSGPCLTRDCAFRAWLCRCSQARIWRGDAFVMRLAF